MIDNPQHRLIHYLTPLLLSLFITVPAMGNESGGNYKFYDKHAEGWHWYDDPKEKPKEAEYHDPVEEMERIKTEITKALDTAILNPSEQNVKNYITLQNQISNRSSLFANIWQKVLLEDPKLNYSLIHPTNNLAKQIDLNLMQRDEVLAIGRLAKESGLFFFYKSSCPYCRKFAPIVKSFAEKYQISVIPITLDGISLPEFPDSKLDNGQAAKFRATATPALFAVNPYTHTAYPISYGFISESDLKQRVLDVANGFRRDS